MGIMHVLVWMMKQWELSLPHRVLPLCLGCSNLFKASLFKIANLFKILDFISSDLEEKLHFHDLALHFRANCLLFF